MIWERDLEEARERFEALDEERDLASAREAAVDSRPVDPHSGFFLPLPPVAQRLLNLYGNWREVDEAEPYARGDRIDLDAHGRPVAQTLAFGNVSRLWWWDDDGSFVEVEFTGGGPLARRARVLDGRLAYVATASWGTRSSVQLLTWEDGRAVRADQADHSSNGVWASAQVAEFDPDGRLSAIRRESENLGPGDLSTGLERAVAFSPERVTWDGRISQPEPWPDDAGAPVEPLAVALAGALRDAVEASPIAEPFVLEVFQRDRFEPVFPPRAHVAGAAWRDRMRRASGYDGAALSDLYKAVESGGAALVDVVDRLDDEALCSCRVLTTAFQPGAPRARAAAADPVADALGVRLAEALNEHPPRGAADPFLAVVHVGARHSDLPGRERARAALGEERYARFMASVASTKGRGGATPGLAKRALSDRDALEALLHEGGLPDHAHRLAHELAEVGFELDPGRGRSRLGGPALLPRGEAWPGALTFLAAIDLGELPPSRLPESGWMLFFADLGPDEHEDFLYGTEPTTPGARARVFVTDDPVEVEQQGDALAHRPVVARPFLMLPDGWGARELAGLDVFEGQTYDELANRLAAAMPERDVRHWVGGHATGAQGTVTGDGSVLLFHLECDEALGFEFLDGGTLQFRIPSDALTERDWSRIFVDADSS